MTDFEKKSVRGARRTDSASTARGTRTSLSAVLVEEEHKREAGEGFRRLRGRHFPDGGFSVGDGRGIV